MLVQEAGNTWFLGDVYIVSSYCPNKLGFCMLGRSSYVSESLLLMWRIYDMALERHLCIPRPHR